ncbi:GNAT family N-acetyltransferase [Herbiconiux sp. CPCC 205763]|uniref:GNAT family N-acetyltransferase n=1 Tax=Herbiconiux aconitum TaxID=2970913 RepID=A0ABT2GSN3_9MICO|nr:GNAT family N-acetyltransferase [Herbiconiux aconitum]MCS5719198.1 GNAT family N-acetyltransferase [Herbiconiux aconitum]
MTAVLLTGSRAPATLDLARRFAEEGAFVVVADSEPTLTSASRAVGAAYRVPSARFRPWEFAEAVAGIARRHAVDLVVPTCEETFWLAAAVDGASAGLLSELHLSELRPRLFAPSIDTLRRLHDKAAFARVLDEIGASRPATEVIDSRIAWRRRAAARAAHPEAALVVKPAFSRFGSRTRFVGPGEPLPAIDRITRDEAWLIQERLAGAEFCSYAVAVEGRVTAFVAYRPVWRAGAGAGVAFERLDASVGPGAEARAIAELLAAHLSLTGQFGLDLMATPAGVRVLECNPRATSGVHLFAHGDGLAGAFSGVAAHPPSLASARLAIPHAMYAVAGMKRPADVASWVAQLRSPDALRPPGDRVPMATLLRSVAVQWRTSRRARVGLTEASTYDLEWNGELVPGRSGAVPSRFAAAEPSAPPSRFVTDDSAAATSRSCQPSADGVHSGAMAAFVDGVRAAGGTAALVANVDVEMGSTEVGGEVLPVTSPARRRPGASPASGPPSYVVSPFTHYVHYAREELGELPSPALRVVARLTLGALSAVLRAGRVDEVVMVGNALLSTNLLPDPEERAVVEVTARLVAEHPGRAIAWRSVHGRGSQLPETLRRAGYRLIPSRSVLFAATRDTEWSTLRDVKRDRALLEGSGFTVRRLTARDARPPTPATAATPPPPDPVHTRIAELYRQLYIAKYSTSNPQYTAEFVALAQHTGLLEFTLLERDGRIVGVFGSRVAHGLLTAPLVGYDTSVPQEIGLYRMLSYLIARNAHDEGVDLHNSSGVADFKRNRGGEPELEYTAVSTQHLPARQRAAWAVLDAVVNRLAVPMVTRHHL